MVNYACGLNQSETGKYFEWIVKRIISKVSQYMYVILCTNILSALHNQMHSNANQMHGYICEKNPTYPRYVLIDTSMKDNLQQNG